MGRKKSSVINNSIEILNEENEEDWDVCGFTETVDIAGTPIASFNFNQDTDVPKAPVTEHQTQTIAAAKVSSEIKSATRDKLIDTRTLQSEPNGITPPVNGEYFEVKRTFIFRRTTLRMLNQLKAAHPNENAYLSSIVDAALQHYYNHIFNEDGRQG